MAVRRGSAAPVWWNPPPRTRHRAARHRMHAVHAALPTIAYLSVFAFAAAVLLLAYHLL